MSKHVTDDFVSIVKFQDTGYQESEEQAGHSGMKYHASCETDYVRVVRMGMLELGDWIYQSCVTLHVGCESLGALVIQVNMSQCRLQAFHSWENKVVRLISRIIWQLAQEVNVEKPDISEM
jgi:hypothetical protein